ncbi:hypothetical protein GYMLUDRAFT_833346 [Collybiopsis luxurians FD-317 M1]|uniref:Uncharacterized protein n=1 Tax=Collybiopsis luxurians FD-317 M1 TaxID=944289 RepID=A0A0D0C037_9AGAR|nr:hypothetical protein GYMLUDRAFT_833346 [Collybiopsis luxurians FD-317 M1]
MRRKNSLGKIAHYPSKILGKILPRFVLISIGSYLSDLSFTRRGDSPQGRAVTTPDNTLNRPPLRRAETTVRRPKRSCELERPDESNKRWSIASTQAIRAETFSRAIDQPRADYKRSEDSTLLPPSINQSSLPPPLTRSMTQLNPPKPRKTAHSIKRLDRNHSERRPTRPFHPSQQGLASEPNLPATLSSETTIDTIASIAQRIVTRELQASQHDSWDFLDYYAQS